MRFTPLALALTPTLICADTLVVGPPGSGAPFNSIAAAVEAAAPGDTVHVLPAGYSETETIDIQKPLALIGSGSASTTIIAPADGLDGGFFFDVRGLAAGEEVRIAGFRLEYPPLDRGPLAVVEDCAGPVVLADLDGTFGPFLTDSSGPAIRVENSAQVTLDRCLAEGSFDTPSFDGWPALHAVASDVHVNACRLEGGIASAPTFFLAIGDAGPAILAENATVRVSRSELIGGQGASQVSLFGEDTLAGPGAAAVEAIASVVTLRGGPGASATGGWGGVGVGIPTPSGSGGPALRSDAASTITTTPDVALSGGLDGVGLETAPALDVNGTFTTLLDRLATLAAAPTIATIGGLAAADLSAEPGALFFVFAGLSQGPALAVPGLPGLVVLPLGGYSAFPPVALDGAGAGSLPFAVPPTPELAGVSFVLQGLASNPGGLLSISAPSLVGFAQ
ncbi:MAG: hypothetical protein AAF682_06440 [Planctomycetota bacterium]